MILYIKNIKALLIISLLYSFFCIILEVEVFLY